MMNRNQLTTIIDFILAPICATLCLTDATHNAILNILLIIIPVIGTWLSEKYPDSTIITPVNLEEEDDDTDDDEVVWIEPIHNCKKCDGCDDDDTA